MDLITTRKASTSTRGLGFDCGPTRSAVSLVERDGGKFIAHSTLWIELHAGYEEDLQHELPFGVVAERGRELVSPLMRDVVAHDGAAFIERVEGFAYQKAREAKLRETAHVEEFILGMAHEHKLRAIFVRAPLWMAAWTRHEHVSSEVVAIIAEAYFTRYPHHLTKEQREHINDALLLTGYGLGKLAGWRPPFDLKDTSFYFKIEQMIAKEKLARKEKRAKGESVGGAIRGDTRAQARKRSAAARAGHMRRGR